MNRTVTNFPVRRTNGLRALVLSVVIASITTQVHAQLIATPQANVQALAAAISGPGVTISNPIINCHVDGYGEFAYSGSQLGLASGVILTTGRRDNAIGPNNSSSMAFNAARPGSAILNIVTGRTTFDQCKLEFDVIPAGDSLKFNFSFGSEEYNEWVGTQFNDVFGFFISGPGITGDAGIGTDHNIALIPGSGQPVTINNVNNGANSQFYHDNTGGSQIQYDGFTQNLSAVSAVQPCQTYHLKLIVADATDNDYDSGVLIERVQSNPVTMESFTQSGGPDLIEGCNNGWVRFTRSNVSAQPLPLTYFIQGTATNGSDYQAIAPISNALPKSITIPANQAFVDRPFTTIPDALPESTESIRVILGNPNCPAMALDTVTMNLVDTLISSVTPNFPGICLGGSVQFQATGGTTWSWTPATGLSATNIANPIATPSVTTNYQVVISDGQGCSRTIRRTVRVSNMVLSGTSTPVLCNGGSNGAINLTVTGGIAPFTYAWTGPNGFTATSQDITSRRAGTYTVTVTDAACVKTQSFTITQPNALAVSLAPTVLAFGNNIACNGASTGAIDGTITGGMAPYSVAWIGPGGFTSTDIDISGRPVGTYSVTVTDFNGCSVTANSTLTQSSLLTASISTFQNVSCMGANNGSATVTRAGGTPPYSYSWNTSPVQTTQTATNLPPGNYTVTVTDAYGCARTASRTITEPPSSLSNTLVSQTNVLCRNASTGAVTVSVSGGTTPYVYSWNTSPTQNTGTATALPAGTFICTITDANGCSTTRSVTITQPAAGITTALVSQQNVSCFGGSNGSATISASGGNPPYTYAWNSTPVQTGTTVTGRTVGNWICTVTDGSGCTATRTVTITQPAAALSGFITSITNNSCFGQTNGTATASGSGGTAPYTYSWSTSPAQTGATVNNRLAGTWTCTITDAHACTATVDAVISSPAQLVGTVSSSTDIACFGQNTGSATVGATGGSGSYSFTWNTSPPQTTNTASNIPFGSYTAVVTDGNGCTTNANVVITQPASPLGTSAVVTPAACGGPNTGAVNLVVSGGTSPYGYQWSGPNSFAASTQDISSLAAGVYSVLVTDANGCTSTSVWNVNPPGLFTITGVLSNYNGFNVGCRNGNNGSIDVSVSGGTPGYSYTWTGPSGFTATSQGISGLSAGQYTFTVTDAAGCSSAQAFTLNQPPAMFNTLTAANSGNGYNVSCFGGTNGAVTSAAGGGVAPYGYAWTGPGAFTSTGANVNGRVAGTYTLTVTDANACGFPSSITLTQPTPLSSSIAVNNHVRCRNGNTGRATVTPTGGVAPYAYSWNTSPVQTSAMAINLPVGTYTCTVTDANGCTTTANVTITQPAAVLSAIILDRTDVLCKWGATGTATVTASGGTGPYAYSWNSSPVQSSATATNLAANNYQCTVTDANGCTFVLPVSITQPASSLNGSSINNIVHATCFGLNDGSARANGSGGTPGYSYTWNTTTPQNTQTATNLPPGTYNCTITDINGCTIIRSVTINGPNATLSLAISAQTNELCGGSSSGTGSATAQATGGTAPYSFSWNTSPVQTGATATALQNGTYTCTVTDARGCTAQVMATITEPTPISNTLVSLTQITCNGAHNGTASVQGTGGTPPYAYAWSFGATTATVSNLYQGTYTCTIRDAHNCTSTRTITITEPAALFVTASTQTASCQGMNSGAIDLTVTGGVPPYTYVWTGDGGFTATTQDISGLTAGVFQVTVTDANGCTLSYSRTVTDPGSFTINGVQSVMANGLNLLCPGSNNAWITNEVRGGQAPYAYSWTGPNGYSSTSDDVSGLSAGTYVFHVVDANGCSTSVTYTVTGPAPFLSSITGVSTGGGSNISCTGGSDGSTAGTVSGGNAPLTFAWSGPGGFTASTMNISGRPAGTYTLNVTDALGCTSSTSIILSQPTVLTTAASVTAHVLCTGMSTGSATATASGGIPPYAFNWNTSPAQSGPVASNLPAGTWTCTVVDANNCSTTTSVTINQPVSMVSAIASTMPVQCFGTSTGTATASASGGTPNYTYSWNTTPAQTTATATGLFAGLYSCTITDANGCTTIVAANVAEPSVALSANISAQIDVLCFGNSTGSATVSANGGTSPYLYSWNTTPSQSGTTAMGLPAGTWTCTITDARGCSTTTTATIDQPAAPLSANIASQTNVACFGNSTGSATVNVTGGTSAYSYSWNTSPVQTNASATGLTTGTYNCTITDASGCTTSASVNISQPAAALSATIGSQTNVACFGSTTGTATVNVGGGTAPYAYSWNTSPVQTTVMATGLSVGNHTCTITDALGCTTTTSANITQPTAALSAILSSQINVNCHGSSMGSATVSVTGGTGSYSYLWSSTPAQSTAAATGLQAGNYSCTVTDGNGCSSVVNATISEPTNALSASITAQTNVLCFGNNTGSVTTSAAGGTGPFTYLWNTFPVQNSATATGLSTGPYTCTVSDANGCITTIIATIAQPAAMIDVTGTISAAACQGANNGAVDATISGGTGAYGYSWTGPNAFSANTQDITGVGSGVYTLVVTDANGCTNTSNWNVSQPGLFTLGNLTSSFTGGVQVSCIGATDGSIDMTVSGATPPYTYSWTGPNGFTNSGQDISSLGAGTYTFVVTDDNGCSTSQSITLNAPAPFNITLSGANQGNGFNIACAGGNNGAIDATTSGGTAPLSHTWAGPNSFIANTADLTSLFAGTYVLSITDVNGCSSNESITLNEPPALIAAASMSNAVYCAGGNTGSAASSAVGGVAPYGYSWNTSPVQTTQAADNLMAGLWTVTITDANGCSSSVGAMITEPAAALSASIGSQTNVLCYGNNTGNATTIAANGTAPYSYSWNTAPVQSGATANNLNAGTFTCTITDANDCATQVSSTITGPAAPLQANITSTTTVNCFGGTNGDAIASATGGTGAYNFIWNSTPVQTGSSLTDVAVGTYTVVVSDENGCSASTTSTITGPNTPLSAGISSLVHQDCFGSTNGMAQVNAVGGTAPYTYGWSTAPPQTGATAIGLGAGTYTAIINDARGCTTTIDAIVNGPSAALSVSMISTSDVVCFGASTGAATALATGGTSPYSYSWNTNPPTFGPTIVDQAAGTYTLTVTDANGCSTSINATINQPTTEITAFTEDHSDVNCFGGDDGFATLDISGGSGSYTVIWNTFPVQTGNTVTGLAAGNYQAQISDNNGCTQSKFHVITINEPLAPLTATNAAHVFGGGYNTSCSNTTDGSIDATITGGTAPYTYAWTDPFGATLTTQDIAGLGAGTYALIITDANGCTATTSNTLNVPAAIDISSTIVPAACQGAATGSIHTNPLGGVAPYALDWSGPNGFNASTVDIANLIAGIYTLSITDQNGCAAAFPLDVNQPGIFTTSAILSSYSGGQNVSCATATDGSINASIAGGTPAYTFNWSGPNGFSSTDEDLTALAAGIYNLTISDANGCSTLSSWTLTAPATLNASTAAAAHGASNISCHGGNDGSINATITGGTGPYTISWTGPNGFTSSTEDPNALIAGTYTISVSDVNGCTATSSITLVEPAVLTASAVPSVQANGDNISCNGSIDGSIDLGINGGNGPYTVLWTGPNGFTSTDQDNNGLDAGTYNAIITDATGCTTSLSVTLTEPAPLTLTSTVSSHNGGYAIGCYSGNDGTIDLTLSGGAGNTQFAWVGTNAFVSTIEDPVNLYAGTYSVIVTDQNGCSADSAFVLTQPQPIIPSAVINHVHCFGQNTGSINLIIAGGTAPFSVSWSGPGAFSANTEDLTALFSGVYIATITDANGCSRIQPFNVNETDAFSITTLASAYAGGYAVSCNGEDDGTINVTVQGGTAPYFYQWIGPDGFSAITEDLAQLSAGSYFLILTDQNGCQGLGQVTLTEPSAINIGLVAGLYNGGVNTTCANTPDGTIDAVIAGGEQPYTLNWSGPNGFTSASEDITGIAAGSYTLTVIDANGCTSTSMITLTAPTPIVISLAASQFSGGYNIPCAGQYAGTIIATISGGLPGYTYSWISSNGYSSTDQNLTGVPAGDYKIIVTDMNGCTSAATISLTEPPILEVDATLSATGNGYEVSCAGNDGTIALDLAGGTAPYMIEWFSTNGFASLDEDLVSLTAGIYSVIITDDNGCQFLDTLTLTAPDPITALVVTGPVVCDGGTTGTIDMDVTGGASALTYAWTGPNGFVASTQDLSGLAGGNYTVTVNDNGNCTGTWTAAIIASSAMTADVYRSEYGSVNIPCSGDSTGVIEVGITGGVQPLNAQWNGPGGFTSSALDLSGLIAGDYHLSIIDGNGCTMDSTITLIEPANPLGASLLAALFPSGSNIACFGGADGSIDATVAGGIAPYTFDWRGPDSLSFSTEDISGLVAGEYTLVALDSNSCATTVSITLVQPDSTIIDVALSLFNGGFNTTCDSSNDGSISVMISGGSPDHSLAWIGPSGFSSSNDTISSLIAGTYSLTTTDINGCSASAQVDLVAPLPVLPALLGELFPSGTNISCAGLNDGAIGAGISGGTPGYILTWTGPNGFSGDTPDIGGLGAGEYCLNVTDANGCGAQQCVILTEPTTLAVMAISTNADCGQNSGDVDATITGGNSPFTYLWSNGATTEDLGNVGVAAYGLTVVDLNGCVDSALVQVAGAPAITGLGNVGNALCNGNMDGTIDLTMLTGTAPYQFDWTGGADSEDLTGLSAGAFQVQVTDASGCAWSGIFVVNEPDAIAVDSTILVHGNGFNISALGAMDGSIAITASGGTAPYTYLWSNGATDSTVEGLGAGTWSVTITDANGCTRLLEFTLDAPNDIEMPTGFTPNGDGHNDLFVIHGIESFPNNQLLVFNRWGNVVYDRINYKNDWAGENRQGEFLPNGTYFLILRLGSDATNLQGYVDLRR